MSKFSGGCLCGSMSYEIDAEPVMSAICHCTHCRRQTGSAFSTIAAFPVDSVKIEGHTLETYEDTGDSGMPVLRKFCKQCGSPLFTDVKAMPGLLFVKTGTLDHPEEVRMGAEIWCKSKLPATTLGKGLPQFEGNPPTS